MACSSSSSATPWRHQAVDKVATTSKMSSEQLFAQLEEKLISGPISPSARRRCMGVSVLCTSARFASITAMLGTGNRRQHKYGRQRGRCCRWLLPLAAAAFARDLCVCASCVYFQGTGARARARERETLLGNNVQCEAEVEIDRYIKRRQRRKRTRQRGSRMLHRRDRRILCNTLYCAETPTRPVSEKIKTLYTHCIGDAKQLSRSLALSLALLLSLSRET